MSRRTKSFCKDGVLFACIVIGNLAATVTVHGQTADEDLALGAREPGGMAAIIQRFDLDQDASTSAALVVNADQPGLQCADTATAATMSGSVAGNIMCIISVRSGTRSPEDGPSAGGDENAMATGQVRTGAETIESILRGVR